MVLIVTDSLLDFMITSVASVVTAMTIYGFQLFYLLADVGITAGIVFLIVRLKIKFWSSNVDIDMTAEEIKKLST